MQADNVMANVTILIGQTEMRKKKNSRNLKINKERNEKML
jgi:hypothetical protein